MMKHYAIYIIGIWSCLLAMLTGCDVHEWPEKAEEVAFNLELVFHTDMGEENWFYADGAVSRATSGHDMRYIIRAYPMASNGQVSNVPTAEWTYYKDNVTLGDDYSYSSQFVLPEGSYRIMVWTDFTDAGSTANKYYNYDNFNSIVLHGTHKANTDYRDAFSGSTDLVLESTIVEGVEIQNLTIKMKRPLAKYTFVATDLQEFIDKELIRLKGTGRGAEVEESRQISLDDYTVVVQYPMYMPNTYNLFTDKAVNSATGVQYRSKLTKLNDSEASMGFDYVVINDDPDAKVTVRVGLMDKQGNQLVMSPSFNVPLKRSVNSIIRGKFLVTESDGGISIDPSFNGDHNIVIP